MTASPHTVGADQSLTAAHKLMRKYQIRHLPVLDGGKLVGLVSQRDLHLLETLRDVIPEDVRVDDAMTRDPYTVTPTTLLRDAAAYMADDKIGSAVVVEGGKVVGIFTTTDALRALVDLQQRVGPDPGEDAPTTVVRPPRTAAKAEARKRA
ncbi:MAG: CBS domain-containing protein [Deltaproteobacteria bacterium]|nr:CBS domain-containing protein [Deltaproteobacteria bacterium]